MLQNAKPDEAGRQADELIDVAWDAEVAILRAHPKTPAGAVDLLMFAAQCVAKDSDYHNSERTARAMVNAARAIAGPDPSKIKLSDELAALVSPGNEDDSDGISGPR